MMSNGRVQDVVRQRAAILLEQLEPIIQREIAAAERRAAHAEDQAKAMHVICKEVGKATDRLLQAKHTKSEGAARAALERAVVRLRDRMRSQP